MTDIEQKARALVADVVAETRPDYTGSPWNSSTILNEALYRAIEQHEAFKQEVSDAVEAYLNPNNRIYSHTLSRFIIPKPKPDPLVEVLRSVGGDDRDYCDYDIYVKELRAALKARGLEIREKNDD
jgi:hypothetical protein